MSTTFTFSNINIHLIDTCYFVLYKIRAINTSVFTQNPENKISCIFNSADVDASFASSVNIFQGAALTIDMGFGKFKSSKLIRICCQIIALTFDWNKMKIAFEGHLISFYEPNSKVSISIVDQMIQDMYIIMMNPKTKVSIGNIFMSNTLKESNFIISSMSGIITFEASYWDNSPSPFLEIQPVKSLDINLYCPFVPADFNTKNVPINIYPFYNHNGFSGTLRMIDQCYTIAGASSEEYIIVFRSILSKLSSSITGSCKLFTVQIEELEVHDGTLKLDGNL